MIILIFCYSFLVLLVIPLIYFPLYFNEYYERLSWLGRTVFRMKEHSRAAVIGDMNALAIADGINWEETKVLNFCDIGGM